MPINKDEEAIIDRLDVAAEYKALGVELANSQADGKGWIACHAFGREDRNPSAAINVQTGRYKDHGGNGSNLSLWEFAATLAGRFPDWKEARAHYADQAGVTLNNHRPKAKPDDHLAWLPWQPITVALWCRHKPGVTVEAVEANGGRLARYRDRYYVVAFPVYGPQLLGADPVGWVLFNTTGGELPIFHGKGQPITWEKMKTTAGSQAGLVGQWALQRLDDSELVWKVEGLSDLLATWAAIPAELRDKHLVVTNSGGANEHPRPEINAVFTDHTTAVVGDCDEPGQVGAGRWSAAMAAVATECKAVLLPYSIEKKHGKDLRDYFNEGHTYQALLVLRGGALAADKKPPAAQESEDDPHRLANLFIDQFGRSGEQPTLVRWREQWWRWHTPCYQVVPNDEIRSRLNRSIKQEFDRINLEAWTNPKAGDKPITKRVTRTLVSDTLAALESLCVLPADVEMPTWLTGGPFPAGECLVTASNIIHLPGFVDGSDDYQTALTPTLFTANAVPYEFALDAPAPEVWINFLDELWPKDSQSIDLLQEWFGLCLLPDTRYHKMLWVIGPQRSGKGTIARMLTQLVGIRNVCNPRLAALVGNFGLQPLLGKTLAIVSDARLSYRHDVAQIVEVLLNVSGEDRLTVDRKNRESIEEALRTRFVLMSNVLPELRDMSGALVGRVLLLRTSHSFLGREDRYLFERLIKELPGILLWAIEGFQRLRERGHFVQPASAAELLHDLDLLTSPVRHFIQECCVVSDGENPMFSDSGEVYKAWVTWCKDEGKKEPGSKTWFFRDIHSAYPSLTKLRKHDGGSKRDYIIGGLALKEQSAWGFEDDFTKWGAGQELA